jgi:hypothetical protein
VAPIAAIEVVMGRLTRAEEYARLAIDLAHRHGWEALGPAPWAPSTDDGPAEVAARAMRRLQGGDPASALRLARAVDVVAGAHPTVRLGALLVEAVARESLHEPGTAAALELAEGEGVRRPFLSAGAPLRDVLRCHAGLCDASAPLPTEILDVLPATAGGARARAQRAAQRARARGAAAHGDDPPELGDRGRALRLGQHGQDARAQHLRKLDVGPRREAVARAREVGLR